MLSILFATHNPAKIKRYREHVILPDIEWHTIKDLGVELVDPEENGQNEVENAEIKARAYWEAAQSQLQKGKWVAVSLDTGLYFDNVEPFEQPGKAVQRIAGAGVVGETDDERFEKMARFYSDLATKYNGSLSGYFLDVFCLFDGKNVMFAEGKRPIVLTNTMHHKDVHFPVASFFTVNGKPYHALDTHEMVAFIQPSLDAITNLIKPYNS